MRRIPQLFFLLLLSSVLFVLAAEFVKVRSQFKVAYTRAILLTYARACTNYYSTYGEWPKSLNNLFSNKSNILFVSTTTPNLDAWGDVMQYVPYDPVRGFASIKSFGSDGKLGGSGARADLEVHVFTNGPPVISQ
jgi:hypothetical protein